MTAKKRDITLGDFISLQRGHDLTDKEREEGQVPVIGAAGPNGFHNEALAKGPGVVVGRSGAAFGKVHFCHEDFWPHNTGLYVTDFKGNDPYFAYYFLKNINFDQYNSGSAQPSLNRNYIYPIRIQIPQPAEQKRIASVLSALDAKIELNNQINAELEGMAKLIYDYWFVQYDFPMSAEQAASLGRPALAGHPYRSSGGKLVLNETLNRPIPEGWEGIELREAVELSYGKALKKDNQAGGTIPVYGSGGVYGYHNQKLSDGPGIIVGRKGSVGTIYWEDRDFFVADTAYYVVPKSISHLSFLYQMLKTLNLDKMNSDSAVPGLSRERAYMVVVTRPPVALLDKFEELLQPQNSMKFNLIKQNQELTQLRDWLLPMLMNGQVTVQ